MEIGEVFTLLLVLLAGFFGLAFDGTDSGGNEFSSPSGKGISVASFNGQIFGDSKLDKIGVDYYVDLVREYDVLFLLEIRDKDGSSFEEVCNQSIGYSCLVSNRSGRSSSKEAVGVFYRDGISITDYGEVEDLNDSFERDPFWVEFGDSDDRFYVVHLKPDDVAEEMEALENLIGGRRDVVLLGDLNADCSYYKSVKEVHFDSWDWLIGDEADTTTGLSDCAYDRVIVSEGVEVLGSGVVEIDSEVSDHHLVWVELDARD